MKEKANEKQKSFRCRAPGKLVIVGEYAVLEGAPALSVAVNRFSHASITTNLKRADQGALLGSQGSDERKTFEAPTLELECKPLMEAQQRLSLHGGWPDEIEWIRSYLSSLSEISADFSKFLDSHDLKIQLNTEDFYESESKKKLGLGGSGASLVSLALALQPLTGETEGPPPHPSSRFDRIRGIQKKLGPAAAGSGIDIATALVGGWIRFEARDKEFNPKVKKLKIYPDLYWCAVWTESSASTRAQISKTLQFKEEEPYLYEQWMETLTKKSKRACDEYEAKKLSHFLEALQEYEQSLSAFTQEIGIPSKTPVHERAAELCKGKDIVYKPSGAGVGDMGLVFSLSKKDFDETRERLKASGFQTYCFKTPLQGARVS